MKKEIKSLEHHTLRLSGAELIKVLGAKTDAVSLYYNNDCNVANIICDETYKIRWVEEK